MKALNLPADLAAFWSSLVTQLQQSPQQSSYAGGAWAYTMSVSLPAVPARPTNPVHAAFYDNVLMPMYNALAAQAGAIAAVYTALNPPPLTADQLAAIQYASTYNVSAP